MPSRLLHGAGGQFMGPSCCVGGSLLNSIEDSTCHLRMRLPLLSLTASLAAPGSHLGAGAPPSSGVSDTHTHTHIHTSIHKCSTGVLLYVRLGFMRDTCLFYPDASAELLNT